MASTFGWLDTDESERKKVLEIVQLFKEEGTIDELGIGSIRDTIANALFPGTSVLHTRLRYVLFIPWLLQRSAREANPEAMMRALRQHEISLISALMASDQSGVIGQQARSELKRFPSAAYWAQLSAWGLKTGDGGERSITGFFRHAHAVKALDRQEVAVDDLEARQSPNRLLLDAELPPAPKKLLTYATFDLTADEEVYLSTKIAEATTGTLLSWMVTNQTPDQASFVWDFEPGFVDRFPAHCARIVEHGRRFHTAIHGAALLYNLQLAEKRDLEERIESYRQQIDEWRGEMEVQRPMDNWIREDFWAVLAKENSGLSTRTAQFVDAWLDVLIGTDDIADHGHARKLIAQREYQIKRGRARLANTKALDEWRGDSGMVRLDYRWGVTQRLLTDLYRARTTEESD